MNLFYDANILYDAGTKAMSGSRWKYNTQMFEQNHLLETAHIQQKLMTGEYQPTVGNRFVISERGTTRYITSASMPDKTVAHAICDEVLTPSIQPFLQYDNSASQEGKGVDFHRKRFEAHLHQYYAREGTNEGFILLGDFSGYYANILHEQAQDVLMGFARRKTDEETARTAEELMRRIFKTFEIDVSRFSDAEIAEMYRSKVNPVMNIHVPERQLTGEKMLKKGLDIGNQLSQDAGIAYPYRIDNYIKIVKSVREFGRYTDDFYVIHRSREFLLELLDGIRSIAAEYGLIINEKKTRICKLSDHYRHLQIQYSLTETGRVIRKIHPKAVTRERRKLKAYKRLLDAGKMIYEEVENDWKSWISGHWKYMSNKQISNLGRLYFGLFGRRATWKKHGRLRWLLAQ
jgi:hypothetical protein